MSSSPMTSRRQLIRWFSGAPLLPLSTTLGGTLAVGSALGAKAAAPLSRVSFKGMAAPTLANPLSMATVTVGSTMTLHFRDQRTVDFQLSYQPFFVTGDWVPDGQGGRVLAGGYVDIRNAPIMDRTVPDQPRQYFSDCPDGTSLLAVPGAKVEGVSGKPVFAVVQFEYTTRAQDQRTDMYAKLPSPIAVLTLDQHPETGRLSLVKYHNVDTSGVNGLWVTCGASLSPWGTHLSSEEYPPDAFAAASSATFRAFSRHLYGDESKANPYHYGHLPEVTVRPDGTATIRKHHCLGRISHELVQVMPDRRTVLMGDDATNGGLFVFVADQEGDLSAGTLYVARVGEGFSLDTQAARTPLSWIRLGHARSDEVLQWANTWKPTDILSVKNHDPEDGLHRKVITNGKTEWVQVLPGMAQVAAFLETHRYAAWIGGSLGFSKMEGTTVNIRDKVAYSALQNCQDSMVVGGHGHTPGNGIALPKANKAGAVMEMRLRGGQKDLEGRAIRSEWMPMDTRAMLVGQDMPADALGNTANPDHIANPDNLKFSERMRTLFIGEDSGQHVNNFLWAYNVDTRTLSRLMSLPAGAESTGLHAVDELNGWTYIMSNFQHPGDWGGIHGTVKTKLDPLIDAAYKKKSGAAVGYLTGDVMQPSLRPR